MITKDGKIDIGTLHATVVNQDPIDKFTIAHFVFGFAMAKLEFKPYQAVFAAVSFELIEDQLKDRYPQYWPYSSKDSKENSLVDVLASLAGFGIGRKL